MSEVLSAIFLVNGVDSVPLLWLVYREVPVAEWGRDSVVVVFLHVIIVILHCVHGQHAWMVSVGVRLVGAVHGARIASSSRASLTRCHSLVQVIAQLYSHVGTDGVWIIPVLVSGTRLLDLLSLLLHWTEVLVQHLLISILHDLSEQGIDSALLVSQIAKVFVGQPLTRIGGIHSSKPVVLLLKIATVAVVLLIQSTAFHLRVLGRLARASQVSTRRAIVVAIAISLLWLLNRLLIRLDLCALGLRCDLFEEGVARRLDLVLLVAWQVAIFNCV